MARRIACGHCGSTHGSIAEVRACSRGEHHGAGEQDVAEPAGGAGRSTTPRPPTTNRPAVSGSETANGAGRPAVSGSETANGAGIGAASVAWPEPAAEMLAGPPQLGRSLLIGPDQVPPAPWQGLVEVAASAESPPSVIDRLHQAWRSRERLIIRWSGPLPDPAPVLDKTFHRLAVDEELPGERLNFAVTANAVDLLDGAASFAPLSAALRLGARPAPGLVGEWAGSEPGSRSAGDLAADDLAADDGPVWVDGGPLNLELPSIVEGRIVPRCHLEAGSLRSLGRRQPAGAELAPDQLAAVEHVGGPARILAPAGSGKTRVLTERARHLVNDCGLEPRAVSLVAYNRRAKDEMATRLADVGGLDIRTLNSLALAIATGSGPFRPSGGASAARPTTIDELEVRRLLDRVVPGRRRKKLTDPLEPWIDALSACRLGLRDPEEIESAYGGDVAGFPEVLDAYRQRLAAANALDFDEQILRAIDRLLAEPAARATARSVAPVLLVDEFQDLTPAHLLLLRVIAGPAGEVFGVGDDDQTIYGYAGASPDWLIDYSRFFPGAEDHRLTVNYRCPAPVVEAAVNLLSYNRRRVAKEITAGAAADAGRSGLSILSNGDPHRNLSDHVSSLVEGGAAPADVAVLTRVNAALLPAAVYLQQARDPGHQAIRARPGRARSFRCRGRPQLAATGGRAGPGVPARRPPHGPATAASFAAPPRRRLGLRAAVDQAPAEPVATAQQGEGSGGGGRVRRRHRVTPGGGRRRRHHRERLDHDLRRDRPARRRIPARSFAASVPAGPPTPTNWLRSSAVAALHPEAHSFESWLRTELASIPTFEPDRPADAVTLATIHTTKGLEWPHVVVHDVRDGLYPHRLAADVEEERRIFHVAVTRGRESVAVTVSGPPSPFVAQLTEARPPELPWPQADAAGDGPADAVSRGRPAAKERAAPASADEASLRETLTDWRRDRAKHDGVPAYVVLDNKTLDAIAQVAPRSLAALGEISGIGPAKLERYGADILGLVSVTADD